MDWLKNWESRDVPEHPNLSVFGIPEPPPTMIELYQWHRAAGMLEYFFANICPDPTALIPD